MFFTGGINTKYRIKPDGRGPREGCIVAVTKYFISTLVKKYSIQNGKEKVQNFKDFLSRTYTGDTAPKCVLNDFTNEVKQKILKLMQISDYEIVECEGMRAIKVTI